MEKLTKWDMYIMLIMLRIATKLEMNCYEKNNIILPVISFEIVYKKPARYDEPITVKTTIKEVPKVRLNFEFEIKNEQNILLCKAKSTVVFVDSKSRLPKSTPDFIKNIFKNVSL